MADYFTTPKTNWIYTDGIGYGDLNRIEENIDAISGASYQNVRGFGYLVDNTVVGEDGVLTFFPGACYSFSGVPIKSISNFQKNLTVWAQGNGDNFGGMAAAVTVAAHTWYYAFVIMDPTDGSIDLMFDDNPVGTNISSGVFTEKRYVNCFKTRAAGGDGSFDLVEMYSTGDRVFINPDSMYATRYCNQYSNSGVDDTYQAITLGSGGAEGLALPARAVLARLNLETYNSDAFGLISKYLGVMTVPANFLSAPTVYVAEFLYLMPVATKHSLGDVEIMVDTASQLYLAMKGSAGAYVNTAIRGFTDERLV